MPYSICFLPRPPCGVLLSLTLDMEPRLEDFGVMLSSSFSSSIPESLQLELIDLNKLKILQQPNLISLLYIVFTELIPYLTTNDKEFTETLAFI